jgi:hypothetical protein
MSSPSREHLLGYLLGALERTEHEQVEAELEANPALRAELERLEHCLGRVGLDDEPAPFDPPADLAVRTCRFVATRSERVLMAASRSRSVLSPMHGERRSTWVDLLTVASVLVAAAALFFPALNHSLIQAERAACQNNLRQIGLALHQYSSIDPSSSFPQVELVGNRGVAGIYAPILANQQLVLDSDTFLCPSSAQSRRGVKLHIPTLEEIDKATDDALAYLQQKMGGDYGYNLGYTQDGNLHAPRNASRREYVLMADAPNSALPGRRSANHGGHGQNVLYEDGHIKFIIIFPSPQLPDHPFYNLDGRVAAGLTCDDNVVGASSDRP